MKQNRIDCNQTHGGFSLVELLVVLVIVSIVAALSVPAANTLSDAKLKQGIELLQGKMSLARQTAIRENQPVEVRFYRYSDPLQPGGEVNFRALQYLRQYTNADGQSVVTPISKVERLPSSVVILDDPRYSTLVTDSDLQGAAPVEIDEETGNADYYSFFFLPDGSARLRDDEAGAWFLTIANESGWATGELPDNFITLQIEPFSGTLRRLRPQAGR